MTYVDILRGNDTRLKASLLLYSVLAVAGAALNLIM